MHGSSTPHFVQFPMTKWNNGSTALLLAVYVAGYGQWVCKLSGKRKKGLYRREPCRRHVMHYCVHGGELRVEETTTCQAIRVQTGIAGTPIKVFVRIRLSMSESVRCELWRKQERVEECLQLKNTPKAA